MERWAGIETEYGFWVEGGDARDLAEEARQVVRSHQGTWVGPWDHAAESPRADMRGFEVGRLSANEADLRYDRESGFDRLSRDEQRSDHALPNGGRLYNDHGHPEYATPECRTLADLAAHDRAGERTVLECARSRGDASGRPIRVYKNNTDFHGISYGCHESYLTRREVPFERLYQGLVPFLVTRQLYAGSGKVGAENGGPGAAACRYQMSQRADFVETEASVDTLARRPLFNTRDEPHATAARWRRLHVICGDALMSGFATWLKVGATAAVLDLVESGWEPLFRVREPVRAVRSLSRDPGGEWLIDLEDGRRLRATDIQRLYLRDAAALLAGRDAETDALLAAWEELLEDLDRDPFLTVDRLDWTAKWQLLRTYAEAEEGGWDRAQMQSLDLEYHNLDPEEGLHRYLEASGAMRAVVDDSKVEAALRRPPMDTRAGLRGLMIERFGAEIERIAWGSLVVRGGRRLALPVILEPERLAVLYAALAAAKTPEEGFAVLSAVGGGNHADV